MMATASADPGLTYGMLDTSVLIDLGLYAQAHQTPDICAVSTIALAELAFGVAVAKTHAETVARSQAYATVKQLFDPIPFSLTCADVYGQLAALILDTGRSPRPRRFDLMMAAAAVDAGLPLYTANPDDFRGLESRVVIVPLSLRTSEDQMSPSIS
ncbi:MAG: type II toxin-antitoxin system VapC family toxin [Propionibacteriaceae bacterium]|jgi:predicted nucleic acid-binding protein|nr:type II toxin-antitoxin system VapC family toxin [Propionibacteriaceae bacterium]